MLSSKNVLQRWRRMKHLLRLDMPSPMPRSLLAYDAMQSAALRTRLVRLLYARTASFCELERWGKRNLALADAGEGDRGRRTRSEQFRCKSSGKPSRIGAHARASLDMPPTPPLSS